MTVAPSPPGPGESGTRRVDIGPARTGSRGAARLVTPLVALLIFVVAAWVMLGQAARVGYNGDEGQFIATAGYFDVVFRDGQLTGPPWEETYWTLTQPPVASYILGAAIRASGNPVPRLDTEHRIAEVRGPTRERYLDPAYYRDERRLAEERRIERPPAEVLRAARTPMALFGAGAVALLFLVARTLSGLVGGLVAAAGLLWTPLALQLLPRAHTEGPLMFFALFGLYLGILAARAASGAGAEARPGVGRCLALGALAGTVTGLAAATKVTALLAMAAVGAFGAWSLSVCWWAARRHPASSGPPAATVAPDPRILASPVTAGPAPGIFAANVAGRSWRWSLLAAALSVLVFVGTNPFLWPNPVERSLAMLRFRQQEMFGQRTLNEALAVPDDLPTRAALLLSESFVLQMPLGRRTGVPAEAGLALVGAGSLAWSAWQARRRGGLVGPEALMLVWVAVDIAGTAPNLGIDWDRYYLPTVGLGLALVGVGADALARATVRATRRWRSPARGSTGAPVAAPS